MNEKNKIVYDITDMKDKIVYDIIADMKDKIDEFLNMVDSIGNQNAYTDSIVEKIIELGKKLEGEY